MGDEQTVVQALVRLVGLDGPAAPPYYPRSEVERERYGRVLELLEREVGRTGDVKIGPFFDDISDMSFFSSAETRRLRRSWRRIPPRRSLQ